MDNKARVRCIKCETVFWISDAELPDGVKKEEAFVCYCPECEKRTHVKLEE